MIVEPDQLAIPADRRKLAHLEVNIAGALFNGAPKYRIQLHNAATSAAPL